MGTSNNLPLKKKVKHPTSPKIRACFGYDKLYMMPGVLYHMFWLLSLVENSYLNEIRRFIGIYSMNSSLNSTETKQMSGDPMSSLVI